MKIRVSMTEDEFSEFMAWRKDKTATMPKGNRNRQNKRLPKIITIPPAHRNIPDAREGAFSVSGVRLIWLAAVSRIA